MTAPDSKVAPATTISVSISAPAEQVYAFVANPQNLPLWATAFAQTIRLEAGTWILQTTAGSATITFAAANPFGILDHTVTLENGTRIYVPMRVVRNGTGSTVLFTLFQGEAMSEAEFIADAKLVEQDLHSLKSLLKTPLQD